MTFILVVDVCLSEATSQITFQLTFIYLSTIVNYSEKSLKYQKQQKTFFGSKVEKYKKAKLFLTVIKLSVEIKVFILCNNV